MSSLRTCIGCRRTCSPDELVRLVRLDDGSLVVGRHQPGRGAWLCRGSTGCLDRAVKRNAFERAFRHRVENEQVDLIRPALRGGSGESMDRGSEGPVL